MVLLLKDYEVLRGLKKLLGRAQPILPPSGYDRPARKKTKGPFLSRCNIVRFQFVMLYLRFRDPGVLLTCPLRGAAGILTHHSILLGSKCYCPIMVLSCP